MRQLFFCTLSFADSRAAHLLRWPRRGPGQPALQGEGGAQRQSLRRCMCRRHIQQIAAQKARRPRRPRRPRRSQRHPLAPSQMTRQQKRKKADADGLKPTIQYNTQPAVEWGGPCGKIQGGQRTDRSCAAWPVCGPPQRPCRLPGPRLQLPPSAPGPPTKEQALAHSQRHVADEAGEVVGQHVIALGGALAVDDALLHRKGGQRAKLREARQGQSEGKGEQVGGEMGGEAGEGRTSTSSQPSPLCRPKQPPCAGQPCAAFSAAPAHHGSHGSEDDCKSKGAQARMQINRLRMKRQPWRRHMQSKPAVAAQGDGCQQQGQQHTGAEAHP